MRSYPTYLEVLGMITLYSVGVFIGEVLKQMGYVDQLLVYLGIK